MHCEDCSQQLGADAHTIADGSILCQACYQHYREVLREYLLARHENGGAVRGPVHHERVTA